MTRVRAQHPEWIKKLLVDSRSYWDRITHSALFTDVTTCKLSVERIRFAITNFYPVIESFPEYLGIMLSKVPPGNAKDAVLAREWLIENLHVEEMHANWFVKLAKVFGVSQSRFVKPINPPAEMDAINNYLWYI